VGCTKKETSEQPQSSTRPSDAHIAYAFAHFYDDKAAVTNVSPARQVTILQQSFKSSDSETQQWAEKSIKAIEAGNFGQALYWLRVIEGHSRLSQEQQKVVKELEDQCVKRSFIR
jgi:hypothetical protein